MRTWSPHSHYSLNALPHEEEATVIEQYSEQRNGFAAGEKVRGIFPDGSAVLEITRHTQTSQAGGVQTKTLQAAGFASREALRQALPDLQKNTTISLIRFRVLQILSPGEGKSA